MTALTQHGERTEVQCCWEHTVEPHPGDLPDRVFDLPISFVSQGEATGASETDLVRWAIAEDHFAYATIETGLSVVTFQIWDLP